jgi:hypothetical protein
MRSPAYGPNWPRCAPIWRFCSTRTCRTGPPSKPIAAAPTATGWAAQNPRAASPPAGSTPKTAMTSTRTPTKARSSTSPPSPIRPRPIGRRRLTAAPTADRRSQEQERAAPWRGAAAARVVTTTTAAAVSAGPPAHPRASIHLGATATGTPARPAARTSTAATEPRPEPEPGYTDAAGLAACARRRAVDTRGRTGQQLGGAGGAGFVGPAAE